MNSVDEFNQMKQTLQTILDNHLPYDKKVSVDTKNHLTETEKKEIIDDYGEALQGIISVYYEQQDLLLKYEDAILLVKFDYDVVCDEHEIYDNGLIYLNKCSIDDKEVKYSFGKKQ